MSSLDIDLDFENVDGVKEIMRKMYGEDNVACISTFGTNQIKGVIKDVCRVHDIDHAEANKANAKIDKELQAIYDGGEAKSAVIIKLDDVYRLSPTFRDLVTKYPKIEKPIQRLYGKVHHAGRHASGVVIGDNLPAETALFYSKGTLQTSFTDGVVNKQLSAMGLVKFDILGLATLSVIHKACELIAKKRGVSYEEALLEIDPKKMDFNDQKVMKTVFADGNMSGIFQLTSRGIRKLAMQMKPDCFNDVAALGALYRPGPLGSGMDQLYIENKRKVKSGEELKYEHEILKEILQDTYGVYVYQEAILDLGRKLGKLSWKDTNRLRKLFLKRTKDAAGGRDDEAEELKAKLAQGFIENGLTQEYADRTWQELSLWASYGFNSILHSTPIYIVRDGKQQLIRIIDCEPGDMVLSRDESTNENLYVPIGAVVDEGDKEIFEFTLDDGKTICCTMNHKFRTTTGEMLPMREIFSRDLEIASIAGLSHLTRDTTEINMKKDVDDYSFASVTG